MTTTSVVIAVDIGTTATKTLAVSRDGRVVESHSIGYPLHAPAADRAEQDPEELFAAVADGIRAVVDKLKLRPEDVLCVTFSSAMHSLIAVDKEMRPLTPCITWADNRSAAYVDILKERYDGLGIYRRTGTPLHPMSPLLKLMWMRDHEPEIYNGAYQFLGIKEFVFARCFGRTVIDHSLASATCMFNLEKLEWDEGALRAAGIDASRLPEPVPTTYKLTGLRPELAARMGLGAETPFVVGASDGVLANLGVGAHEPGVYAVTIGTSGAIRGVVAEPRTDAEARLFCYALQEGYWVVGGPINNGGIMFRWVRDELATLEAEEARKLGQDPYDYLSALAAEVQPGSEGLIFLALMAGERAPYWNPNARGVFFGLSLQHGKKHMVRAVLEGIMYRLHSVAAALRDNGADIREIRASGGFARSPFLLQLLADVLGVPVTVPESIEASGLGAAMLGLLAVGEVGSLSELDGWVDSGGTRYEPNPGSHATYEKLTAIYAKVYHQLEAPFSDIAAFQNEQSAE
ncbi:gluconokinase [Paenibacillus chartarius]|uniref:Gluconokinase n=1 Tax=Paenibacillus chartarius TaxID=747481 RepID=A0ABV6DKK0_9BACL